MEETKGFRAGISGSVLTLFLGGAIFGLVALTAIAHNAMCSTYSLEGTTKQLKGLAMDINDAQRRLDDGINMALEAQARDIESTRIAFSANAKELTSLLTYNCQDAVEVRYDVKQ